MMWSLLIELKDKVEPLVVPDSLKSGKFDNLIKTVLDMDAAEMLAKISTEIIWVVVKIALALCIYFIGRYFIRRLVSLVNLLLKKKRIDRSLENFFISTVSAILTIALMVVIMWTVGVNISSLMTLFASVTLALGLALSGTAQNFAGGIMILLLRPYKVGDYIEAQGEKGTVRSIMLFSTLIETVDRKSIYIPNNTISTSIINNYSTAENRRVDWLIGISYGDDVDVARATILEIIANDSRVLPDEEAPEPRVVWVGEMASSSVNLYVRVWVRNKDYWGVFFENNEKFYKVLPTKGINFPFPQLDVHLKNN